jgi:hypothetical protein
VPLLHHAPFVVYAEDVRATRANDIRSRPKADLWLGPTARIPLPSLVVFKITSSFKRAAVNKMKPKVHRLSIFLAIQTSSFSLGVGVVSFNR